MFDNETRAELSHLKHSHELLRSEPRSARLLRLVVAVVVVSLVSAYYYPTPGLAACRADDDACLEQEGNNDAEVDVDAEARGGDAIAGSQVISVTGGGDKSIVANNTSRFARAKGGDVNGKIETTINNGPKLEVETSSSGTTANAGGTARTTQDARPNVTVTLDQLSLSTGTANLSSTALASNFTTGTNFLSQSPLADGAVNQAIDQLAAAPLTSTVMPEIDITGDNTSFVTGSAPVTQSATVRTSPVATAIGSGAAAAATGEAVLGQVAAPSVVMSLDQFAAPTGGGLVSNSVGSSVQLEATNDASAGRGPVDQSITQSGSSPVTSTFAPAINVAATNAATIIGSSPVNQSGTARTSPRATALGGLVGSTAATLTQVGNNVESVDVDMALIGGDAIAGSNVIGVAGAGNTTIIATNESLFARAQGGNTEVDVLTNIVAGPRLTVSGATAGLLANATGVAAESQTAAIGGAAALDQNADADGTAALLSLVNSNVTLDAVNSTTTVGGPVSETINQTGVSPITQPLLATFGVAGSNAATVLWHTGVVQAGSAGNDPQAVVVPGP
jgi:hypothetical protein